MIIDDLRRTIEDLPGDMPVLLLTDLPHLSEPELEVAAVDLEHRTMIWNDGDGHRETEALVIS